MLAMVGVLIGAGLVAQTERPKPPDVGPGRVAWFDISTTNITQAKAFYGKLFDWTFAPLKETDQAFDIVSRGAAIGTLRAADGQVSAFNGAVYVQVHDIQASCTKARELGGTIAPGFPFNLPGESGAICLAIDPSGHPVGMYSRTPLQAKAPSLQVPAMSTGTKW
jgi:predicted enzyme related to lactoylglutathione lyase